MRIHKFETTEAFIAIDLEGAEASSGPARWAKKILQGGRRISPGRRPTPMPPSA